MRLFQYSLVMVINLSYLFAKYLICRHFRHSTVIITIIIVLNCFVDFIHSQYSQRLHYCDLLLIVKNVHWVSSTLIRLSRLNNSHIARLEIIAKNFKQNSRNRRQKRIGGFKLNLARRATQQAAGLFLRDSRAPTFNLKHLTIPPVQLAVN